MCGISGFINFNKNLGKQDLENFGLKMSQTLHRRGPDSFGVWTDERSGIVLSHRRLSIIDLSEKSNQPMMSSNDRYILVYNGEVYNYLEIKKKLEKIGVRFKTNSDTEIILESISKYGIEKSLYLFNGMFSFAVWDRYKKKAYLARDRLGIKPLYWYFQNKSFGFASELKALKALPWINFEIDKESLSSYVRLNYIPAPHSIFKKIFKVLPGHFIEIDAREKIKIKSFWSLKKIATKKKEQESNFDIIKKNLEKSVKNQMRSDVPLGVFLSGGIDSSLITCLAQKNLKTKINTFTIGFKDAGFDEASYAKNIANFLGTNHNEEYFDFSNFSTLVDKLGEVYDEPFADSSQLPTLLLSKITKKKVTVALSGDGGDEVFGGYYRYFLAEKYKKWIFDQPAVFKILFSKLVYLLPINFWNVIGQVLPSKFGGKQFGDKLYKLGNLLNNVDETTFHKRIVSNINEPSHFVRSSEEKKFILFDKELEKLFPSIISRMQFIDTLSYLPDDILTKVDRASMFFSLEVRVPFLDHNLVENAWNLPINQKIKNNEGKLVLKKILENYLPRKFFDRPKMGFGIPLSNLLSKTLESRMDYYLNSDVLKNQDLLNIDEYKVRWKEHKSGKRNWQFLLWNFFVFQIWYEHWNKDKITIKNLT